MLTSEFLFALCQRGAERALKAEVARRRPELHAAYQRPGLVTWKSAKPLGPEERIDAVLARVSGLSLGTVASVEAAKEKIAALPPPLRLHVIERDLFRPDEAPPAHKEGELARATEEALRAALPGAYLERSVAREGELVLSVVVAPEDPILLGLHRHAKDRSPHPGGRFIYDVPVDAPSRAYRKTEEALLAFELPIREGDRALELGAAPGGGVYALLRRGVHVLAVDPADMDAKVLAFEGPRGARARHVRKAMNDLKREDMDAQIQWLFMDVNLAPQVALRSAARVASLVRPSLLGAVLTLKLNDWSFLERLDAFLATAREMGLEEPRARQLPAHRQEIVVSGLTARGRERASRV